jgi:hypothetical protein
MTRLPYVLSTVEIGRSQQRIMTMFRRFKVDSFSFHEKPGSGEFIVQFQPSARPPPYSSRKVEIAAQARRTCAGGGRMVDPLTPGGNTASPIDRAGASWRRARPATVRTPG